MKFLKMRLLSLFILFAFMIKANGQVVTVEEIIMINNTAKAALITVFSRKKDLNTMHLEGTIVGSSGRLKINGN